MIEEVTAKTEIPCPRCGGHVFAIQLHASFMFKTVYSAFCDTCKLGKKFYESNERDAIRTMMEEWMESKERAFCVLKTMKGE